MCADIRVILFLLLLQCFFRTAQVPHPVLLIPGLGGSQMQARLHREESSHWFCQQTSDWYRIWMSMTSLMPYAVQCFADNFRLVYNKETGLTKNVPGVETRVENFGNVTTMEYFFDVNLDFGSYLLDSALLHMIHSYSTPHIRIRSARFFQPIISRLESRGYERTRSLRAAQYDFRKAPCKLGYHDSPSFESQ